MSTEAHLESLQKKHAVLEQEIADAMMHPATDDLEIVKLKRQKLRVKEEIEKLRHEETRH